MEGRKKRVEKVAGPVERRGRRIDSARNTRFQLLGYHFIKPGDSFHVPVRGRRGGDRPSWMASAVSFLTSGEMGQTWCITPGGVCCSCRLWERDQFSREARTWICQRSPPLWGSMWLIVDSYVGACVIFLKARFNRFFLHFLLSEAIQSKEKEKREEIGNF